MRQFLISTILFTPALLVAQQPDGTIRLRIDAELDGKTVVVDTFIESLEDFALEEYLHQLGLEEELGALNIDIRSGYPMDFDEEALHEMLRGFEEIEMPEIPHVPMVPMFAGEGNKALLGVYSEKDSLGARISGLVDSGAATLAGLMEGDIITGIDKRTIESPSNLSEVIAMYAPGDQVTVTFMRMGKEQQVSATLQENKTMDPAFRLEDYDFDFEFSDSAFMKEFIEEGHMQRGFLGVYLEDADGGTEVTGIVPESAAEKGGLKAGDRILELNGSKMKDYEAIMEFMRNTKPGEIISITYKRDGKTQQTDVILQENVQPKMYYFNWSDGEEEGNMIAPDIRVLPEVPYPPGCAYTFKSPDGNKDVYICITASPKSATQEETGEIGHPLMEQGGVHVYSNPSSGTFNVQFNLPESGDTFISITDMQGKEVYTETVKNFSGAYDKTITLDEKASGTYFVKVSQNGYSNTSKVIIQ